MKTDKYERLNNIANGFRAASQIKSMQGIQKEPVRSDGDASVITGSAEILQQILSTIAQYSPDTYRGPLNETLQKANTYSESYRNLKQHLSLMRGQGFNKDHFMKMFSIIHPVVDTRRKHIIDKILKVYDIINS